MNLRGALCFYRLRPLFVLGCGLRVSLAEVAGTRALYVDMVKRVVEFAD